MKKNISINISGIIFHIEEEGFDQLKNYLERINTYFKAFEDSSEVISDIESRIAEIFLSKLNDGKQVISLEDVEDLIATLGKVEEFKTPEPLADIHTEDENNEYDYQDTPQDSEEQEYKSYHGNKRLYRDAKRKIIGGVAAGLANYFRIDALWVRLLFLLLFLDVFFTQSVSLGMLIAYLVLWAVLPGSETLEEDKKIKKLYRNPDEKVIAGISGGLAAYFGVDPVIFRLLFIITTPIGGTGLIAYLILWIITPEASTITEKLKMKGEPITLSNIEQNIKKSLKVEPSEEENVLVKILLFPFRLLAMLVQALGNLLGPLLRFLVEAIRIIAGIILIIIGLSTIFSLTVMLGACLGMISYANIIFASQFPYHMLLESFPASLWWFSFIAAVVPAIFVLLLGISTIAKRIVFSAFVGWSLFAIWMIGVGGSTFLLPQVVSDWKTTATFQKEYVPKVSHETLYLLSKNQLLEDYNMVRLSLQSSEDSSRLVAKQNFKAHGSSRAEALNNAAMVSYPMSHNDSSILIPTHYDFNENAIFRNQQLEVALLIPIGQHFIIDRELNNILTYNNRTEFKRLGGRYYEDKVWYFDKDSKLQCVNCEPNESETKRTYSKSLKVDLGVLEINEMTKEIVDEVMRDIEIDMDIDLSDLPRSGMRRYSYGRESITFNERDYSHIEASSIFHLYIKQGPYEDIKVFGRESDLEDVTIRNKRGTLVIDMNNSWFFWNKKREFIKVEITVPELEGIQLSGASKAYLYHRKEGFVDISLSGASSVEGELVCDDLKLKISSASKATISGKANSMHASLSSASKLSADDFKTNYANVKCSGASNASIYASKTLDLSASGASKINYIGNATINRQNISGAAKIIKNQPLPD